MEHVVFSAAENGAGEEFRRVASLEEAVRVVEHLRNDLGITDPSVFALTPVPVAFKTYYRVEVPGVAESVPDSAPEAAPEAAFEAAVEELPEASESSLELAAAELPMIEEALEAGEDATADGDFLFDGNSGLEISGMLPDAPGAGDIPASRSDAETERSLGYFAR
jgi:hypothetical protein